MCAVDVIIATSFHQYRELIGAYIYIYHAPRPQPFRCWCMTAPLWNEVNYMRMRAFQGAHGEGIELIQ